MTDTRIAIFKGKEIRKTIYKNEWWFSVVDIAGALTRTDRPRKYWNDLKTKLIKGGYAEVSEKIGQLKLPAPLKSLFDPERSRRRKVRLCGGEYHYLPDTQEQIFWRIYIS